MKPELFHVIMVVALARVTDHVAELRDGRPEPCGKPCADIDGNETVLS